MPSRRTPVGSPRDRSAGALRCPWCQGELLREQRRTVDHLQSLFAPVRRYRCNSYSCQWIGNLSSRPVDDANRHVSDGDGSGCATGRRSHGRVSATFVVHMVLVAVGVVFVIVFSSVEHASWVAENAKAFESTFLSAPEPSIRSVDAR